MPFPDVAVLRVGRPHQRAHRAADPHAADRQSRRLWKEVRL